MKKKVLLLIALLLPLMANAQLETIDGIRYYFSTFNDCYQVQRAPFGYSGEIVIHSILNGKRVQEIDKKAFCNNQDVTSVHLAFTINNILDEAFSGCSGITSIEIPQNVVLIGAKAFANCKNLKDIYCFAKNPSMGIDVFDKTKGFILHVPAEYIPYYKDSKQWKNAKKVVAITTESWAAEQYKRELAEQERLEAEARQKQIQDSIAAREKQIKDSIEAKQKLDSDLAAAEKGDAAAMVRLGIGYEEGKGVEKNIQKAVEYYQRAADLGNVEGQFNLGRCYYNGTGFKRNPDAAMIWIEKAVAQGHERAKIYKELFDDEFGSYYKNEYNWRIRIATGTTVKPVEGSDHRIKTDHFEVRGVDARIDGDNYRNIAQEDGLFKIEYLHKDHPVDVNLLDADSYIALSKEEKIKLIEKELCCIDYERQGLVFYKPENENGTGIEAFYRGKFYPSWSDLVSVQSAEKKKATEKQMAPWVKRFGFDPSEKSTGQLIRSGRSFKLLCDWYNHLAAHGDHAEFRLSIDHGSSKCYDVLWGTLFGNKIGYIWVHGDKVTTVVWY